MPDLINPIEMYLKAILEMQEEGVPERRVRIAERLEQSGPTVTKTVLRMERDHLVSFSEESKKLSFTPRGFRRAMTVMRKHRLAECFLDDVVGLDWTLIHDEACRWEHAMSDEVADRVDALMHHPERTPYGNPIPPSDADRWDPLAERPDVRNLVRFLNDAGAEQEARVEWIGEGLQASPQRLGQLRAAGVGPGAKAVFSLHGPSVIVHDANLSATLELPHRTAAELFVRP